MLLLRFIGVRTHRDRKRIAEDKLRGLELDIVLAKVLDVLRFVPLEQQTSTYLY